jgi:hypothetical protein
MLAAAGDRHSARLRINAVFDQLGDRLQWAGLRQGNDGDGVPVAPTYFGRARGRLAGAFSRAWGCRRDRLTR